MYKEPSALLPTQLVEEEEGLRSETLTQFIHTFFFFFIHLREQHQSIISQKTFTLMLLLCYYVPLVNAGGLVQPLLFNVNGSQIWFRVSTLRHLQWASSTGDPPAVMPVCVCLCE